MDSITESFSTSRLGIRDRSGRRPGFPPSVHLMPHHKTDHGTGVEEADAPSLPNVDMEWGQIASQPDETGKFGALISGGTVSTTDSHRIKISPGTRIKAASHPGRQTSRSAREAK